MSCNCKKANEIVEAYGEEPEKTLFEKMIGFVLKVILFLMVLILTVVIAPIIIVVAIYKICFSKDNKVVLPKVLSKHLK